MSNIRNPLLPGFYPDPSVCRAGEDYYLACSSFEMYPGIPLFHSKDLMHWEQICNVMTMDNGFHVEKTYGGGGIMAPTIRYHDGLFYIICCNFSHRGNFIVTAEDPKGPWSSVHWLEDIPGIDASLFFDDDGSCYVVGTGDVEEENSHQMIRGIWIAEFDCTAFRLKGKPSTIFYSAMRGAESPEAPHIYHIGEYYYLVMAEGGTDQNHSVVVARNDSVYGLYENNPANPVITHRMMGSYAKITNVGHADLTDTQDGRWYAVMLASRNIEGTYKVLGRETYLCPVKWEHGWPFFSPRTGKLELSYEGTGLPETIYPKPPARDDFDKDALDLGWVFWGTPYKRYWKLHDSSLSIRCIRQGLIEELQQVGFDLTVERGRDAFAPFIARRQTEIDFDVSCCMHFKPAGRESAGLAIVQQMNNQYHLERICENGKGFLQLMYYHAEYTLRPYIPGFQSLTKCDCIAKIPYEEEQIIMKITARGREYVFRYGSSEEDLKEIGRGDAAKISTSQIGSMTGTLVGMYATGNGENIDNQAEFKWFEFS